MYLCLRVGHSGYYVLPLCLSVRLNTCLTHLGPESHFSEYCPVPGTELGIRAGPESFLLCTAIPRAQEALRA